MDRQRDREWERLRRDEFEFCEREEVEAEPVFLSGLILFFATLKKRGFVRVKKSAKSRYLLDLRLSFSLDSFGG